MARRRPRILLIHTGGTIGMRPAPGRPLLPTDFDRTLAIHAPELSRVADVALELLCNLDSSDVGPALWQRLAPALRSAYPPLMARCHPRHRHHGVHRHGPLLHAHRP